MFLNILTWKCASCQNGVHFFDIRSSKIVRDLVCLHLDLEMCSAPQQHAIFPHPIFQKWCETVIIFNMVTSKCASRHNGVQFFISHLARWLRTRRFSEPTLGPSGPTNHWKNSLFHDFPNTSSTCIFFPLTLSLSLFYSSLLSDSSHLCFSSLHIVGSLTSKPPLNK